jgi:hypothetical protein
MRILLYFYSTENQLEMRTLHLILLVLLLPFSLLAQQVTVTETATKMGKKKLWCFAASYNFDKAPTKEVIEQQLSDAKLKRSARKKGFSIYKAATWPAISNTKCDYYYKTKSKKNKTTLYLSVSKGYDNYVTTANDAEVAANITRYLQNLNPQIATAISLKKNEAELKVMQQNNQEAQKKLDEAKKEQAAKAGQIQQMRKMQITEDK